MPPKRKMVPKSQVNATVLNLNDKVKFLDFVKGNISLVEIYGENESSLHNISTELYTA
jgi:hypothetical protein